MNLKWTKGLDKEQQEEMKIALKEARLVIERLKVILQEELDVSVVDMAKKDNFFMPAWPEYQASKLGEQRALRKVIELIEE